MNWRATLAAVVVTTAATAAFTMAQDNGGGAGGQGGGGRRNNGGQGGGGGPGGGGGFGDPAQFQQRMMENLKQQLKAQDDEWKVIEPKLTKVMEAQREARVGGRGFGGGGRGQGGPGGGGGGPGGGNQPTTELGTAAQELRTALESESTSADEIDKKLSNYRNAREKANANLATARKDLKEVLTARQEATLVLNGMLE